LWRPLVVWVEKFRLDESSGGGPGPSSWVLDFLRRARLPRRAAVLQRRAYRRARRAARPFERPFRAVGPVILRGPRFAFGHRVARRIGVGLGLGAVALMVLAGQWYILFNVISAVAAVPEQLKDAATVFRLPRRARWRSLYLPAAFPALVTGWVTAAGGAWNGSIVAE